VPVEGDHVAGPGLGDVQGQTVDLVPELLGVVGPVALLALPPADQAGRELPMVGAPT